MDELEKARKQEGRNAEAVNRVTGIIESELIVILSILWGGSFFFVGIAVQDVSPRTIVCRRAARPWRLCSDWRL
jgi:hypothetical protein